MISISQPVRVQADERMLPPQKPAAVCQKRLSKDRRSEPSSVSVAPGGPDDLEAELDKVRVAMTFTNSERPKHFPEIEMRFRSRPDGQRASQSNRVPDQGNAAAHGLL
jgi:hypothetical protein